MIIIAILIKLDSKGPIFFIQERIGEGNRKFNIVKFRSMTTDAEKNGPQWASKNDNRVTKFGKIMRATRIDELPQLWNVLKVTIIFVGLLLIAYFTQAIEFHNLYLSFVLKCLVIGLLFTVFYAKEVKQIIYKNKEL